MSKSSYCASCGRNHAPNASTGAPRLTVNRPIARLAASIPAPYADGGSAAPKPPSGGEATSWYDVSPVFVPRNVLEDAVRYYTSGPYRPTMPSLGINGPNGIVFMIGWGMGRDGQFFPTLRANRQISAPVG